MANRPLAKPFARLGPAAPLVLRLVTGVIMAAHGWEKLADGPAGFGEGMLGPMGIPAPVAVAWLVTVIELVGGLFLIAGFLTRVAALANIGVLIGATILVKAEMGLIAEEGAGAELDLALIAGLFALVAIGPGRIAVDRAIKLDAD